MKLNKNVVFIGMPGSGKTTISKLIAEKLGAEIYDVDEYIEKTEGMSITDMFKNGEQYFRGMEKKAIQDISRKEGIVISTGGGVIKIAENMKVLRENGYVIFINRPVENIINNVDFSGRPLLKDNGEKIYELYKERYPLYKKYCDFEVLNDKDIALVIEEVYTLIEKCMTM